MWQCKKCNEWKRTDKCFCKEFKIINEDGDEYEVCACDERDAARKYAKKSNEENEYYLMNEEVEIEVDGTKFVIGAEPDVYYSVNEAITEVISK